MDGIFPWDVWNVCFNSFSTSAALLTGATSEAEITKTETAIAYRYLLKQSPQYLDSILENPFSWVSD